MTSHFSFNFDRKSTYLLFFINQYSMVLYRISRSHTDIRFLLQGLIQIEGFQSCILRSRIKVQAGINVQSGYSWKDRTWGAPSQSGERTGTRVILVDALESEKKFKKHPARLLKPAIYPGPQSMIVYYVFLRKYVFCKLLYIVILLRGLP